MMNTLQQPVIYTDLLTNGTRQASDIVEGMSDRNVTESHSASAQNRGFFGFFAELRRRRVCRAAASYAVAMWLVCQILEIVAPALGLPDWTLSFAILIGLLGFPIALLLSWLFEITPQGLVIDGKSEKGHSGATKVAARPLDRIIDCTLVLAALVIGAQLAIASFGTAIASDEASMQKIVVAPFRVAGSSDSTAWSEGLVIELQHELAAQTGITVISPRDPYLVENSLQLTGSVTLSDGQMHVTATIIDNSTGVVSWSQRFVRPIADSSVQFAKDIVAELPFPFGS